MRRLLLWTVILLIPTLVLRAQDGRDAAMLRMEAFLEEETQMGRFSGVILVAEDKQVILHKAFGQADFRRHVAMDTSNRFMIASLSKAFTAAAVLQLAEEGKVKLSDPLNCYLSGCDVPVDDRVTLYHLLTHSSGIPDYINDRLIQFKLRNLAGWHPTMDKLMQFILREPLMFQPGENVSYSNSGYVLLSNVVERVSGEKFDDYVSDHLLKPIGMKSSGMGNFDKADQQATAFKGNSFDKRAARNLNQELTPGMGGVYSTSGDLFRWMNALQDTLVINGASRDQMFTAQEAEYGFGWMVEPFGDSIIYHHSGYFPGWTSYICILPEYHLSFICLSNYSNTDPWYLRDEMLHLWEQNVVRPMEVRLPVMKAQNISEERINVPTQGELEH
jgi:CubicO group peptidase (beta-lactamase class C family)